MIQRDDMSSDVPFLGAEIARSKMETGKTKSTTTKTASGLLDAAHTKLAAANNAIIVSKSNLNRFVSGIGDISIKERLRVSRWALAPVLEMNQMALLYVLKANRGPTVFALAIAKHLKFHPNLLVTPLFCSSAPLRFNTVGSQHGEILKRRGKEEQRKT